MRTSHLTRLALLAGALLALSACSTVSPVATGSAIEGRPVQGMAMRVAKPFTFKPALYSATFPAGLYLPAFEDADGVYFRAPAQILKSTVAGPGVIDGGLYVGRGSWRGVQAYLSDGSIHRFDIDVPTTIAAEPTR